MYTYLYGIYMAKQIAISDEVYQMLLGMKTGNKSFSEVIKGMAGKRPKTQNIMKYFGAMKGDKSLESVKKSILKERRGNTGRNFKW